MLRRALVVAACLRLGSPARNVPAPTRSSRRPRRPPFSGKLRPDILGISADSTAELRTHRLRIVLQGTRRRQDRYPAAEIRRHRDQLHRGAEFQRSLRRETDRRGALEQLLLARERQPRLFHRTQPHLRGGPAADQGRHGQAGHGQIRRRRPSSVISISITSIAKARSSPSARSTRIAAALDAIDKPLDPRIALKLNGETGRGSCVAVVKRIAGQGKNARRHAG